MDEKDYGLLKMSASHNFEANRNAVQTSLTRSVQGEGILLETLRYGYQEQMRTIDFQEAQGHRTVNESGAGQVRYNPPYPSPGQVPAGPTK